MSFRTLLISVKSKNFKCVRQKNILTSPEKKKKNKRVGKDFIDKVLKLKEELLT